MHYLIEDVARRIPEAEAICGWDNALTYGALDALSTVVSQRVLLFWHDQSSKRGRSSTGS